MPLLLCIIALITQNQKKIAQIVFSIRKNAYICNRIHKTTEENEQNFSERMVVAKLKIITVVSH